MNDLRPKILILDDAPEITAAVVRAVQAANPAWDALEAFTPNEALAYVIDEDIAVFICSQELRGEAGTDILAQARSLAPETVGILTVARLDMQVLLDCVNVAGAFRCLPKPFGAMRLLPEIADAIVENRRRSAFQTVLRTMHAA